MIALNSVESMVFIILFFLAFNSNKNDVEVGVIDCRIPRPQSSTPSDISSTGTNLNEILESENNKQITTLSETLSSTCESRNDVEVTMTESLDNSIPNSGSLVNPILQDTSENSDSNPGPSCPVSECKDFNSTQISKEYVKQGDYPLKNINNSDVFFRNEEYRGLNFFNQNETSEIKHSSTVQNIEMESMGLSFAIPPGAISPEQGALTLSVAPAIGGNIASPVDCRPYSPLFMLTPCSLAKEVKVTVNHTCYIEDEEDCKNMVILVPVDLAESQKSGNYLLKEADLEKEFEVGSQTGEIRMKRLQPFRVAKRESPIPERKKKSE